MSFKIKEEFNKMCEKLGGQLSKDGTCKFDWNKPHLKSVSMTDKDIFLKIKNELFRLPIDDVGRFQLEYRGSGLPEYSRPRTSFFSSHKRSSLSTIFETTVDFDDFDLDSIDLRCYDVESKKECIMYLNKALKSL